MPERLQDIESRLQISSTLANWLKLFKLEFTVVLIAHVTACIFLLIGLSQRLPELSWVSKYSESSLLEQYVISFYYTIITMTTIGYGDITPVSFSKMSGSEFLMSRNPPPSLEEERAFVIIVALISANVFGYSITQISEIVKSEEEKKRRQRR